MSKILVISGHPNLPGSTANKTVLDAVKNHFGDAINMRELDKLYVNGKFDVPAERKALAEADIVVLQFPVYWYSVPGLLKQWIDDVFEYGFAYGPQGTALRGKKLLISATAGAPENMYRDALPYELTTTYADFGNTAAFTGMELEEPIFSYGASSDPGNTAAVRAIGENHGTKLIARLESLRA